MPDYIDEPPEVLAALRAICLGLPEAYEESAWAGTRWRIRQRTFAHVRTVEGEHAGGHTAAVPIAGAGVRSPALGRAALLPGGLGNGRRGHDPRRRHRLDRGHEVPPRATACLPPSALPALVHA